MGTYKLIVCKLLLFVFPVIFLADWHDTVICLSVCPTG